MVSHKPIPKTQRCQFWTTQVYPQFIIYNYSYIFDVQSKEPVFHF